MSAAETDEWVWVPEETHEPPELLEWRTDLQADRGCRMVNCQRRAVAKLYRRPGYWWHYCDRHLYGRRIVGTTIEHQVRVASPAHLRALSSEDATRPTGDGENAA